MRRATRAAVCAVLAAALLCGFSQAASALPGYPVDSPPPASAPPQAQEPPNKLVDDEPVQEMPPAQPPSGKITFPGALALLAAAGIAVVAAGAAIAAVAGKRGSARPGRYDAAMHSMLEAERLRQQQEFMGDGSTPPDPPPADPGPNGGSGAR